jgi:hypothetical protein
MTENGHDTGTTNETDDSVTGTYTKTGSGTDVYTLGETGTIGTGAFTDTVTGTDGYNSTETGNHAMQTYTSTTTGGGSWTRVDSGGTLSSGSGINAYTLTESGDQAAAHFSQSETGTDRYGLVEKFDDVSNANGGTTPGNVTFHAEGLPFRDPLFVSSPAPTRETVLKALQKLYPDGDLRLDMFGKITLGPNAKPAKDSMHPEAAKIITDLINSKFDFHIYAVVGDPMWSIESTPRYPVTFPDKMEDGVNYSKLSDKELEIAQMDPKLKLSADAIKTYKELRDKGKAGPGTGAKIYVPGPNSSLEYGTYDAKGNLQTAPLEVVLAHELAHAWLLSRGEERPLQISGNRPGHDAAIELENKMRAELDPKAPLRGLYKDPMHGESRWRKVGDKEWAPAGAEPKYDDIRKN